ncbi:bacteriorhodopsin [Halorientalis regularis]|jgi:sensory rhodopsin|uniref:Sensory rhodopsin n=1 Tax=Halorientalis regularis TaxID=660518 RepID=A0A1G7PUK1_9EURY|nr:bacteriorhodopsin [Halorientalis regularis]SDF89997.1 sensory rhodopsin [Halorientalis regularis]
MVALPVDPVRVLYALAVLGFGVGVWIGWRLLTDDPALAERGAFKYLLVIPVVAGASYVLMFFDIGTLTVGEQSIVVPRYVDWLITTPILVGYIGYVAGAPRRWIVGLAAADGAMILLGAVATVTTGPTKWLSLGLSGLGHASLLVVLYVVLPQYLPDEPKRKGLFKLLQNHVGLLWLAYPNVWLVGPAGFGLMSGVGLSMIIAYLDVVAKTPYLYFVWQNARAFETGSADPASDATTDEGAAGSPTA